MRTARSALARPAPGVERPAVPRYAAVMLLMALLGFGAGGAMADRSDTSDNGQMARPLLAYRCPTGFDTAEDLCRAFRELLGRAAPGHALRRIGPGEAMPPLRDHDLFITLGANRTGDTRLTGWLDWQEGPDGRPTRGPDVSLDSSDAPLSPGMYADFLRGLWEVSAPPPLGGPTPDR
ncbi:hypothetical protein [Roseovarius sp.]|uniref:hypothetical protein n=1 Tax=Roseovarius sp. TaxID=1486281 RepID=UPI003BACF0D4